MTEVADGLDVTERYEVDMVAGVDGVGLKSCGLVTITVAEAVVETDVVVVLVAVLYVAVAVAVAGIVSVLCVACAAPACAWQTA